MGWIEIRWSISLRLFETADHHIPSLHTSSPSWASSESCLARTLQVKWKHTGSYCISQTALLLPDLFWSQAPCFALLGIFPISFWLERTKWGWGCWGGRSNRNFHYIVFSCFRGVSFSSFFSLQFNIFLFTLQNSSQLFLPLPLQTI